MIGNEPHHLGIHCGSPRKLPFPLLREVSRQNAGICLSQQLNDIRALENFSDTDVTVAQGDSKKSVVVTDAVTVVNAMDKLYMTVTVA